MKNLQLHRRLGPENTREEIFDGIQRKETFGISGPLIRVRFFGGWDFPKDLTTDDDFVKKAYDTGAPMGGDLPAKPEAAKAPTFAAWALKDPDSGNLNRIQIIKGWYDTRGYGFQKIYDVVWSDEDKRSPGENGKLPPVGKTVDIAKATYTNDIAVTPRFRLAADVQFIDAANRAAENATVLGLRGVITF